MSVNGLASFQIMRTEKEADGERVNKSEGETEVEKKERPSFSLEEI